MQFAYIPTQTYHMPITYGAFVVTLLLLVYVSMNYFEKPARRQINNWGEVTISYLQHVTKNI